MNFLPLIDRELRRMSRRPATYYSRMTAAGVGLGVGLALLLAGVAGAISPGSAGHGLVCVLGALGLLVAVFEGTLMTADAISSERREGTLGLLFLTELRAGDIVLGKLVACSGRPFNTLLAMLPVPALGIVVGGVMLGEVFMVMAALLNTLFVAAAIGLYVSAGERSERRATFRSLAVVLLWCGGLPIAAEAWHHWGGADFVRNLGWLLSPLSAVIVTMDSSVTTATTSQEWLILLVVPHLAGWALLASASRRLRRSWREDLIPTSEATQAGRAPASWRARVRALWTAMLREPRRPVGNRPPLRWLAERRDSFRGFLAALALTVFALFLVAKLAFPSSMFHPAFLLLIGTILHLALASKLDAMASRALLQERQSGVLELLLLTPAGADRILDDTLLALKGQILWPVMLIFSIDAVLMVAGWFTTEEPWLAVLWVILYASMMGSLAAAAYFSAWIQLYLGLATGSQSGGMRKALLWILLIPGLVTLGVFGVFGLWAGGRVFGPGFVLAMLTTWIALVVAFFLGLYARATGHLRDNLPGLAARVPEQQSRKPGHSWKSFLGRFKPS